MNDLNRSQIPPGGWVFFQPQTGWSPPHPVNNTFNQTVEMIIHHRLANPAITAKHKLSTDYQAVAQELDTFTRIRLKIPMAAPPKLMPRPQSFVPQVAGAVADIKRALQGTTVIVDWLMSGGAPVEEALAIRRAEICVKCPMNAEGRWFTVAPAEIIKNTLEARKDLNLKTPHDDALKSCNVCKCLMRLKIWTPIQYIVDHTPPEIMAEFPPHCWIKTRDQ